MTEPEPVAVDTLRDHWSAALDAAGEALRWTGRYLPPEELHERTKRLAAEREPTSRLLQSYARDERASARYVHVLAGRLRADPRHTAVFETSPAGIAAARAGGPAPVVAIDRGGDAAALGEAGAD